MKLEDLSPNVRTLRITGAPRLDPITLYLQDGDDGQGNVTIECYGKAWTTWFSAMGAMNLQQFLVGVIIPQHNALKPYSEHSTFGKTNP